jgi:SAM-dependent methyltransferase
MYKNKYDLIGENYNRTRTADPFLAGRLFDYLKSSVNGKYLDIGCGTGNYTTALFRQGLNFIGVDPSIKMLKKAKERESKIAWIKGISEAIPLEKQSVTGILATLTTHHWKSLEKSFAELKRVLIPTGKIIIFTSNPDLMKGYWLNYYFPRMLKDSMNQMPTFESTERALEKVGLKIVRTEKYFVRDDLKDHFLYSGKHHPTYYLNAEFRKGISSFRNVANANEVEIGLEKLENDIKSGEIKSVIKNYENKLGDYLFILVRPDRELS